MLWGHWLRINFKKVLILLLWEMKKVVKILIFFSFPIKTFFNWIINQCPTTFVNMTLNKLGQIEYYFWFKFACAQTKSKVKGIINYRNILAFIKMKMLTNDLRALINNLFKENFYGKKKLIFWQFFFSIKVVSKLS